MKNLNFGQLFRKCGIYIILVLFIIISTILRPDVFLTKANIISILVQISMTTILACGECALILGPVHIRPNTHLSGKFCRLRR